MKTVWKWILGIFIVLVAAGVIVCAVFAWRNQAMTAFVHRPQPFSQQQPGPFNLPNHKLTPNNNGSPFYRGPMMGRHEFMRFGFFPFGMGFFMIGGLLRWILPLGILALVAFLFYQMGKRAGARQAVTAAAPAVVASEPTPEETPRKSKGGRSRKTE